MVIQRKSTPACLRLLPRIYFFLHRTHEQFALVSPINAGLHLSDLPREKMPWRTTNTVAEFSGLVGGLELARDFLAHSSDPAPGLLAAMCGNSRLVIDLVQKLTDDCNRAVQPPKEPAG
jgi:hypothetical protein